MEAVPREFIEEDVNTMDSKTFERICEEVHNAWWEEKKRQGVSDHPDMIPYSQLAENVKEYDRATVRAVLQAMDKVKGG